MGVERYYLPLGGNTGFVWDAKSERTYLESNAQGEVVRAVRLSPRKRKIEFYPCCKKLAEFLTIPLPQGLGYNEPYAIEYYLSWDLESRRVPQPQDKTYFKSAADLASRGLASFDANFWLIEMRERPTAINASGIQREHLLISKRPMMFGRHVVLECGALCVAETLVFSSDSQRGRPSARVRLGRVDSRISPCVQSGPAEACQTGEEFASTPEALRWVEQAFEKLKEKP
jgi:hypothetical protein